MAKKGGKITTGISISPYLKEKADYWAKELGFGGFSDIVCHALTEFITRIETERAQKHKEPYEYYGELSPFDTPKKKADKD